jgi:P4 family phage/plasmid primase-like protien
VARIFRISTGPSRLSTRLKRRKVSWAKLATKLQTYHQIDHTYEQYMAFDRERQAQLKDVGYYIGGWFKGSKRLQSEMTRRSLITLDADHLDSWDIDAVIDAYKDYEFVAHSTMKHSPDTPRLRIVFPLHQDIKPAQYEPASRALANWLGMDCYDDTTFQPARIMFWPAVTSDGEIWKHHNEGELVNPEMLLEMYDDWQDFGEWPHSKRVDKLRPAAREAEDPLTKPGIIGAFNRTYDIHAAIAQFELPYETTDFDNRYRPFNATGPSGAVVYDDVFLYSHHESDVVGHQNVNAWDLVRIHKFADLDANTDEDETPMMKRPSSKQMMALAMNVPEVAYELRYGELSDLDASEARPSASPTPTKANPSKDETGKSDLTFKSLLGEISAINVDATNLYDVCQSEIPRIAAARLDPQEDSILAGALREKYPAPKPTKSSLEKSIDITGKRLTAVLADGEGGIADIEQELVQAVLDDHFEGGKTIKRIGRKYWTYERGLWAITSDERIKGCTVKTLSRLRVERPDDVLQLVAAVGESKTSTLTRALFDMECSILAEREKRDDPLGLMRTFPLPIINCLNCEVHFNYKGKMKRKQHNPDNFFTIRVDTEYDPDAECPEWDRFNEIIWSESSDPKDMQRHLEELGGYVIQMSRWLKTWVLFHGPKDTGKSTVAEVLNQMLGSAYLAQDFGKFNEKNRSTFAESNLIGKLAIVDDDYSRTASLPDGFIKKVSEEKSMTADIKWGESLKFVSRALPMILANHFPRTADISDALNERALVFPFYHRIAGADRSDKRRARMMDELPGILVRFIAGVRRLRKRGAWDIPLDCGVAHGEWEFHANPLNAFMKECIFLDPENQVEPKLALEAYKHWLAENETTKGSIHGLGRNELFTRLDQLLGERSSVGGHRKAWKGWRLVDPRFADVEIISDSEWDDSDD